VKQINEIYPCILTGDYRDQEKKPSPVVDADAKADRERFYSLRRHRAIAESEKIKATFMKDETFAKIVKRLREIDCEQGKAEARGDRVKASKLEQEKSRLTLQKRGIIERNGITEEDLEPKWNCKKCKDTGFVDGLPCDCYEG
jgi:DNA replication protein DnaC